MRCLSLFEVWLLDLNLLIALVSYVLHVQRAKEAAYIASHFQRLELRAVAYSVGQRFGVGSAGWCLLLCTTL